MSEYDSQIIERLIELTQMGRLHWTFMYPQHPEVSGSSAEALSEVSQPIGYVLEDEDFGFGVVIVQIQSDISEEDLPVVHVQGEYIEAPSTDRSLLVTVIRNFLHEIQTGRAPSMYDRIHRATQQAIEPMREQMRETQRNSDTFRELAQRQMNVTENMSQVLTKLMGTEEIDLQADPHKDDKIELTPENLRFALQIMAGPEIANQLEKDESDTYYQDIIDVVKGTHQSYSNQASTQFEDEQP